MNGRYCLWLYLVRGTNGIENNGIMRDYDVIRCESDCAISQKKKILLKDNLQIITIILQFFLMLERGASPSVAPCSLLLAPKCIAGQVLFNVWMGLLFKIVSC